MQQISENNTIIKRRSNFYESLDSYKKVTKVTYAVENKNNINIPEITILSQQFKNYILTINELEPIIIENAFIEIVAPVLKKGKYKWKGIYEGNVLEFNMKSNEFKTLVQTGNIEFKNGSAINCCLEIKRKINNKGEEEFTGYNIIRVNSFVEKDITIETQEGISNRRKKIIDNMPTLFSDMTDVK